MAEDSTGIKDQEARSKKPNINRIQIKNKKARKKVIQKNF